MSDRELAAKFRGSAFEFQRLNPIDVFLIVRRVADPVESNDVAIQTLIDQNKLRDRFGQVHSCSVVAVGGEWEQCILFVDLTSNITRRAFGDWQEAASHAAGLCQAANISPLFNRGHDSIVEFVMALESELHNRNRTEFVDLFKEKKGLEFDLTKGILTSIEDTPKKSARLMEEYATRLAESSAVDAPKDHVSVDRQGEQHKESSIPELALKALLDSGMAGVVSQAIKVPAKQRHSQAMMTMLEEDSKYYGWTLEDWQLNLKAARKTVLETAAWAHIQQWREENKRSLPKG